METWTFEKQAGLILDHQDDPGAGWETSIEPFWPDDLDKPGIGIEKEASDCVARLTDGHTKLARYPTGSPEDAMASSMYFVAYGLDPIEKEAHVPIAEGLKNARVAYGIEIPDGFSDFVKEGGMQKNASSESNEVYVDEDRRLPVTSPDQCRGSLRTFKKNASAYPADDRMVIARKLEHAADHHGIEADVPHSSTEMSKLAEEAVDLRIDLMEGLDDHPGQTQYLKEMAALKERLTKMDDYRTLLKSARKIDEADRRTKLNKGWGRHFPDPVESIVGDHQENPLPDIEKEAGTDWSKVDWEGLREKFDDDVVDKIKSNPNDVIPSLPNREKRIVKEYAQKQANS